MIEASSSFVDDVLVITLRTRSPARAAQWFTTTSGERWMVEMTSQAAERIRLTVGGKAPVEVAKTRMQEAILAMKALGAREDEDFTEHLDLGGVQNLFTVTGLYRSTKTAETITITFEAWDEALAFRWLIGEAGEAWLCGIRSRLSAALEFLSPGLEEEQCESWAGDAIQRGFLELQVRAEKYSETLRKRSEEMRVETARKAEARRLLKIEEDRRFAEFEEEMQRVYLSACGERLREACERVYLRGLDLDDGTKLLHPWQPGHAETTERRDGWCALGSGRWLRHRLIDGVALPE